MIRCSSFSPPYDGSHTSGDSLGIPLRKPTPAIPQRSVRYGFRRVQYRDTSRRQRIPAFGQKGRIGRGMKSVRHRVGDTATHHLVMRINQRIVVGAGNISRMASMK